MIRLMRSCDLQPPLRSTAFASSKVSRWRKHLRDVQTVVRQSEMGARARRDLMNGLA